MNIHNRQFKQSHRKQSSFIFSWRKINIFLGAICLTLIFTYLAGMNDLTVKGFVLKDLKGRYGLLSEENQDLQAKALALQSYSTLSPRLENLNMVAVEDVAYFSAHGGAVARK